MDDKLGFRVLQAVDVGMTSVVGLAVALNTDIPSVRGIVDTLVAGGLLSLPDASGDEVALTEAGAKVLRYPGRDARRDGPLRLHDGDILPVQHGQDHTK